MPAQVVDIRIYRFVRVVRLLGESVTTEEQDRRYERLLEMAAELRPDYPNLDVLISSVTDNRRPSSRVRRREAR